MSKLFQFIKNKYYNFRKIVYFCPICGTKSNQKAFAPEKYVYFLPTLEDTYFYFCHHCNKNNQFMFTHDGKNSAMNIIYSLHYRKNGFEISYYLIKNFLNKDYKIRKLIHMYDGKRFNQIKKLDDLYYIEIPNPPLLKELDDLLDQAMVEKLFE